MTETGFRYRARFRDQDLKDGSLKLRLFIDKVRQLGPVQVKESKYKALLSEIQKANRSEIFAGVREVDASRQASNGKATIGEVAAFQFFGTKTVPPRRPDISRSRARALFNHAGLLVSRGLPVARVYGQLAEKIAGEMKAKIRAGIPPELKYREGTPLIDTGQLWGSIEGEVRE